MSQDLAQALRIAKRRDVVNHFSNRGICVGRRRAKANLTEEGQIHIRIPYAEHTFQWNLNGFGEVGHTLALVDAARQYVETRCGVHQIDLVAEWPESCCGQVARCWVSIGSIADSVRL